MGPNPVWQAEALGEVMALEPGMRVLDMGCGTALSSIFLANQYGVEVWATDLWIKPDENLRRVTEAQLEDQVHPIHAEAHDLPFAEDFFDALVSIGAYHYFGTDDLYLGYYSRFVKPGGQLGIASQDSSRSTRRFPRRTSRRTGNGTSAPGTARPGGVATGRRPAWSPSTSPTNSPTAGGTGCSGTKPATRRRHPGPEEAQMLHTDAGRPSASPESPPERRVGSDPRAAVAEGCSPISRTSSSAPGFCTGSQGSTRRPSGLALRPCAGSGRRLRWPSDGRTARRSSPPEGGPGCGAEPCGSR